jgi:hypothetical protein
MPISITFMLAMDRMTPYAPSPQEGQPRYRITLRRREGSFLAWKSLAETWTYLKLS